MLNILTVKIAGQIRHIITGGRQKQTPAFRKCMAFEKQGFSANLNQPVIYITTLFI
jgi:hypothetical protein